MNAFLPKDGSIVIIDDQYAEAEPLLDLLSANGHPSIYYNGDLNTLPAKPLERVRVVFADIQLIPALNEQNYASLVIDHLNRLIPNNNGPYILIVWSGMTQLYSNTLEQMVLADVFEKKPIAFIRLNKNDYYTHDQEEVDTELESLRDLFDTRFSAEDISFIFASIQEQFPIEAKKRLVSKALIKISNKIRNSLTDYKSFEILMAWENMIQKSATLFISDITAIQKVNNFWDKNIRNIIARLAKAQLEGNINSISRKIFFQSSFRTLNSAFYDTIDRETSEDLLLDQATFLSCKKTEYSQEINGTIYKLVWDEFSTYELYINDIKKGNNRSAVTDLSKNVNGDAQHREHVKQVIRSYTDINSKMNARLHIDMVTKKPFQPGILYKINVARTKKRKYLTTYFVGEFSEKVNGLYKIPDADIDLVKFVELEVSPSCDFAQNKWLKHRLISGVMFPSSILLKLSAKEKDESLYKFPEIEVDNNIYSIIFSFKLLKSIDLSESKKRASSVLFRIKNESMADIVTRMTSHANRIGLITFN